MTEPADFQASLHRIHEAIGTDALVSAIWLHYHNTELADATPRELMYLHIGILVGALTVALDPRKDR